MLLRGLSACWRGTPKCEFVTLSRAACNLRQMQQIRHLSVKERVSSGCTAMISCLKSPAVCASCLSIILSFTNAGAPPGVDACMTATNTVLDLTFIFLVFPSFKSLEINSFENSTSYRFTITNKFKDLLNNHQTHFWFWNSYKRIKSEMCQRQYRCHCIPTNSEPSSKKYTSCNNSEPVAARSSAIFGSMEHCVDATAREWDDFTVFWLQ